MKINLEYLRDISCEAGVDISLKKYDSRAIKEVIKFLKEYSREERYPTLDGTISIDAIFTQTYYPNKEDWKGINNKKPLKLQTDSFIKNLESLANLSKPNKINTAKKCNKLSQSLLDSQMEHNALRCRTSIF